MSKQKSCGVVVACVLLVAFGLAQEGQEGVPTKTSDARMRHTRLTLPGFRQRIDPRAPEVFLSAA